MIWLKLMDGYLSHMKLDFDAIKRKFDQLKTYISGCKKVYPFIANLVYIKYKDEVYLSQTIG